MMYKITHDETGVVHTGTLEEICKITGVQPSSVAKYATYNMKISNHWDIEVIQDQKAKSTNSIPLSKWIEWEVVTAPFKKASERKRRRQLIQGH